MFGFVEADPDVRLRSKVVHLVRLDLREQRHQARSVTEVTVVKEKPRIHMVGVHINVVDPRSVERRRSTDQSVNLVAFGEQQLGEVRAVLPVIPVISARFILRSFRCGTARLIVAKPRLWSVFLRIDRQS
ncbi:hypothetical protein GCM10020255_057430 [Rhodococcus baikonurensis]